MQFPMNENLAQKVLQEIINSGAQEFCICPGGRNAPFCAILRGNPHFKTHFWNDERSAAFFALGRSRTIQKPVAVIVSSGTAAGELLPATMEAHYSGVPLILVTGDRPRRYRYSGAPQVAEQVGIYGKFIHFEMDLEGSETCNLTNWRQKGPCHVNVCFEEPTSSDTHYILEQSAPSKKNEDNFSRKHLEDHLKKLDRPLVIVSTLKEKDRDPVIEFLLKLNAPVYLESISHLREEPRLSPLRIFNPDVTRSFCDGVVRIGGVPTHRMWRDLEDQKLPVHSLSDVPFSGLSYADVTTANISSFLTNYTPVKQFSFFEDSEWKEEEDQFKKELEELFLEEPTSEPSLFRELSSLIPMRSHVYLGNGMPVRNWDLAAANQFKELRVTATRGLNGIDGQLSSFLGLCEPKRENWGIVGDLTTLYDLSAPWILNKLDISQIKIVVINNFGGRIFARKFKEMEMQNIHTLQFEQFAKLWKLPYEKWDCKVPKQQNLPAQVVLELNTDYEATERFWSRYKEIKKGACLYFR